MPLRHWFGAFRVVAFVPQRLRGEDSFPVARLEHGAQIFAMTDDVAERARKIGGTTLHSVSDISRNQRLKDNNAEFVSPKEMLGELCADNEQLTRFLRSTHEICDRHNDVATASLIENWIDETERRTWFLSEIVTNL